MSEPAAQWVDIHSLKPWDQNPRHNDIAASQVAEAINEFGFTAPMVVQAGSNRIIAGHTRRKAVLLLLDEDAEWTAPGAPGPGMVPARLVDVDDHVATRLTIADNRLGDLAVWDEPQLSDILKGMDAASLEHLGFDEHELSALLGTWADPFKPEDDMGEEDDDGAFKDEGVAKITVEMAIPLAQDACLAIHEALQGPMGMKRSQYKMVVL